MLALRFALLVCLGSIAALPAQGKNLLFYGNSFSFFNGGVARLVAAIAVEAGHPAPTFQECLVAGQDLHFHATDPGQVAAIGNFLPPGRTWDVVVVQGQSTEATVALGNVPRFLTSAVAIVGNVRAHSPAVRAVTYQTWARGTGHSFYPATYASPLAMHGEVRTNYRAAVAAIDQAFGIGTASNAAVGDAVAMLEFDPTYYIVDLQHPANEMTLLASMCLFAAIYGSRAGDVVPNYAQPSPLGALLNSMLLPMATWQRMAGFADLCADAALRRFPGSGDQLRLEAGPVPGTLRPCALVPATNGTQVDVRLSSCNGVYVGAAGAIVGDLYPTGHPPAPLALFPEIAVAAGSAVVLRTTTDLASPLLQPMTMPFTVPGVSILLQGFALAPSVERGNPWFTATDGCELRLY